MKTGRKIMMIITAGMLSLMLILGAGAGAALANDCVQPSLGLTHQNTYWASYSDYTSRLLSVDISVPNPGVEDAFNVTIVGDKTTSAATLNDVPIPVGDIPAGTTSSIVTLKYSVPIGVGAFASYLYGSAQDLCNNTYYYPGPYQGA